MNDDGTIPFSDVDVGLPMEIAVGHITGPERAIWMRHKITGKLRLARLYPGVRLSYKDGKETRIPIEIIANPIPELDDVAPDALVESSHV